MPKGSPKHRYPELEDMTFSWRPGKFQRASGPVKETSTPTTTSNKADHLFTEAISFDSLCSDCLPYLGSLEMLNFGNSSNDQYPTSFPTGQWLHKIAQHEGTLHAGHALGYHMASQVSHDEQLALKAQAHYISALSITSKMILQSTTMVSLVQTVAILCAYCATSGDGEGCRTHYQALARMLNDMNSFEMLDRTDRNLLLITCSVVSKFILEPSIVHPALYGCQSWELDETMAEFRDRFRIYHLPMADSLKQGQGLQLAATIQECRELVYIGQQLLNLHPSYLGGCHRVQVWVETRYQVLSCVLINIYCEFEECQEYLWGCITLGVVCALHLLYHTRHDPKPLCSTPFSHLKRKLETLDPMLQAGEHSGTIAWMYFIGACGEHMIEPLFSKDEKWFAKPFKQAIMWLETKSRHELEDIFEQLLYDKDVLDPLLDVLVN